MTAASRHPPELPERYTRILAALVQEYIEHGEPVSSLWLTARARLGVSSATIRNILAELESSGFVRQPHTSAGRVPTDLGYRCYVDLLMQRPRKGLAARNVEARLRQAGTVDDVMANVSQELSRFSHHVGFALAPVGVAARLKHINFVSLGGSKVLVVLITADGQICHKVIEAGDLVGDDELQRAANYLNGAFHGMPLSQVRLAIVSQLREERVLYDALMARALRLASSTLDDIRPNQQLHIQGVGSLLVEQIDDEQFSVATLRALFQLIEEKHRLVRLLSEYIEGEGLTVVIGSEHPTPDLQNFTLVASTYSDGTRSGTVGVIGPTRMRYSRTIAAVDGIASALTRILRPSNFANGTDDDA